MADPQRYQSPLTGPEMDQALLDMANHTSERFAKGTANGVAVEAGTDGYNDNSKFYKDQAANQVTLAAAQVTQANNAANRAANAADRAEAAVPVGTQSAVLFTTAQTLTAAQKAQARANIMAGGSNPNLLDNSWFFVNQRNIQTITTNGGYFADRWYAYDAGNGGIITHNADNTITIDGSTTSRAINILHRVSDIGSLTGKSVTLSIMLADGTILSGTKTSVSAQGSSAKNDIVLNIMSGSAIRFIVSPANLAYKYTIQIAVDPSKVISIKAVKLELGTVSTLANDAPQDLVTERNKCQYYAEMVDNASNNNLSLGYAMCTDSETIYMPFTIKPKRATPSVTLTGAMKVGVRSYDITATDVSVYSFSQKSGHGTLKITASGVTLGQLYRVGLAAGGKLLFSADL